MWGSHGKRLIGTDDEALVVACGMVGLFWGLTNCPVASPLIAFALFGYEAMPCYLNTVTVSYGISHGLYHERQLHDCTK